MSKSTGVYIFIAVIILGVLFILLKPKANTIQSSTSKSFELIIKNKKLEGNNTLTVLEGTEVTFNINADEDEEFHLHGLDKSVDLEASKSAILQFKADKTGRFAFELEHSKTELGALEVQPK